MANKRKNQVLKNRMVKSEILSEIAANTDLNKTQVNSVLQELEALIKRHLQKGSVGEFIMPGLLKIKVATKPARKARKGVANPFRPGETIDIEAKPASPTVRVKVLKKLNNMIL